MFPTTSIPALLLLLSFDNSEIEFIDVSEMYTEVRRKHFTEDDIKDIMSRDFTDRRPVCVEEVLHNDRLLPSYYTVTEIKISLNWETLPKS